MNIYPLDAAILKSSEHRDKWLAGDFHDCMAHLKKHLAYRPDWDEGENWCRFYLNDKTACLLLGVGSSERQNPCVCIPHILRRD